MIPKKNFIITNPIFYRWNEIIIQDFPVHMRIDYWCNDCHLSWSLNDMQHHIMNDLSNILVYFQAVIFITFIWIASDKISSIIALTNRDSSFNTSHASP